MIEARQFTHRDDGTDEATWLLAPGWDGVPRLDLSAIVKGCSRVVVVAPHPDDETLALGATLADLSARNVDVTVVFATHGGSGPRSTPRRTEGDRAIATLGSEVSAVWCDLPDGGLDGAAPDLVESLGKLIDADTVVFAPVECDGHSDHEAAARVAAGVARENEAVLLHYPIWLWHWATPADVDWSRLRTLSPSLAALRSKASAIDCYTSQLTAGDDRPIVGPAVLRRAHRVFETVLIPQDPVLAARVVGEVDGGRDRSDVAEPFDAMLAGGEEDPWHLDDFAYERRRLSLVLACLGRERYQRVLEVGCATGQLSEELTGRADTVVAIDASERALAVARRRTDAVRWICGAAPRDLPDETFDAIILSEIGYFLDGPDLTATLRAVRRNLTARGEIVLAHWRGPTDGIPLDGRAVHEQAAALLDLPLRARYEDVDLIVEVWGEPVSVYREYRGAS
ncbi:PIG-L family deacetylase [Mycolicibacterium bacteremicum]|uniref:PIG-L family deacetylase n=1 Tax=Mycolicibacterium bacteremicum TaxID=564198 RepID=UPI0026F34CD6|nr:PIG-L family deacetylase [Mycolicibacterium bacteremicum]